MAYTKRLVCLANSDKLTERCVAGLEIIAGVPEGWIRPISDRPRGELSAEHRRFRDGSEPALLDLVDVRFLEREPHPGQPENHLIDSQTRWIRRGAFPAADLLESCEIPDPLWDNSTQSGSGINDRVATDVAANLASSLVLVELAQLTIIVTTSFGKRKVRAQFQLGQSRYDLGVTDPIRKAQFPQYGVHRYPNRVICCLSLGEPLGGFHYKLVASIIDI